MRFVIVILIMLFLFSSCGKERNIHITAKNAVTGEPYAGLTYYVVQEKTSGDGEKFKTVATGTLDSNGEAYLTKKLPKRYSYSVRVEAPANTCYNKQITYYFTKQESTFECPFEFAECAFLKLNINNANCQGGGDVMNFRSRYSYSDWEGWSTDRMGCYSFSSPVYVQVPAGWRIYHLKINRGGVISNFIDSVYLTTGNSTIFDLNY